MTATTLTEEAMAAAYRAMADSLDPSVVLPPATPVLKPVGITDSALKLVWNDEFDSVWPDTVDWRQGEKNKADGNMLSPGYPVGDTNAQKTAEKQLYVNGAVTETGSSLVLTGDKRTVKVTKVAESDARKGTFVRNGGTTASPDIFYWPYWEGTLLYESGWASTGPDTYGVVDQSWSAKPSRHDWLYGFFETRVKLPKGKGFWPAAWMLRSDGETTKAKDEIDLFEVVDPACRKAAFHYHCNAVPDWTKDENLGQDVGVDMSLDFHTFAVDWTPDYIRWYFDGKLMQEYTDKANICKNPMYFIYNLAVGGGWPGDPDSTTKFPQSMLIDYLRVWQR